MRKLPIFLLSIILIPGSGFAEDAGVETYGTIMSSFEGRSGWLPTLCDYGYYHAPDGTCVSVEFQSPECPEIVISDVSYGTHRVDLDTNSFRYQEYAEHTCWGMYSLYTYDPEIFVGMVSTGDFYDFGPSMCGYGKYFLDGACHDVESESANQGCDVGAHMTVATDASFMGPNRDAPYCNGDYHLYDYIANTENRIYPIYHGTLLFIGTEMKVNTFDEMSKNKCMDDIPGYEGIGENYYSIELIGVADDYQPYLHPQLGMCDKVGGYGKFAVNTDCKDIDTSDAAQLAANQFCGVLCTEKGSVYTNSGVCSANGKCRYDGKDRRLYVGLPDGTSYSYPLYASKTSWPALNFKLPDDNGGKQTCYVNLVPPAAIDHFTTKKPNPLRLGYPLTWTGPDEKEYSTNQLITID